MEGDLIGFGALYINKNLKGNVVVEVSNQEEFKAALKDNITISVSNDFDLFDRVVIEFNNVVINGNGHVITVQESGSVYFKNTHDIYITDISFEGQGSDWENNLDLLTFDNVQNIIVDKCVFKDGADECVGIKNGSDYITISNTTFTYTKSPKTIQERKNHNFALLIGKNKDDKPESGKFHITLYKVQFEGDIRRCPRMRNGICHIINCTFNTPSLYTIGPENSEIILIDCNVIKTNQFIHKFGDYKCLIMENGKEIYKYPKFSQFNLPEYI